MPAMSSGSSVSFLFSPHSWKLNIVAFCWVAFAAEHKRRVQASGDLAAFGGFDWDAGFVNANGAILMLSQGAGTGNFLLLHFAQSFDLNGPLPVQTLQPASSSVFVASQSVIDPGESGASFSVPELGASGSAAALVALIALVRLRQTH